MHAYARENQYMCKWNHAYGIHLRYEKKKSLFPDEKKTGFGSTSVHVQSSVHPNSNCCRWRNMRHTNLYLRFADGNICSSASAVRLSTSTLHCIPLSLWLQSKAHWNGENVHRQTVKTNIPGMNSSAHAMNGCSHAGCGAAFSISSF